MTQRFGATHEEWQNFVSLGLSQDLLPVVSNPHARISERSAMKALGKTPSVYYNGRKAGGIKEWTSKRATDAEIAKWQNEPDYGICLQTRTVRAFDIDVDDAHLVASIVDTISAELHHLGLPVRFRSNAAKCLLAFTLQGDLPKRVIRLHDGKGIIELLGTGQQFVAAGTHPSGVRYEWQDPLTGEVSPPQEFPSLTQDEVDRVWLALTNTFGESSSNPPLPSRAKAISEAIYNDPTAKFLLENNLVLGREIDGRLHIECPFSAEHTSESAISATSYFPANTGGYQFGHFKCMHAHCESRTDDEFKAALGVPHDDPFDDFEVIDTDESAKPESEKDKALRFQVVPAEQFTAGKPMGWWIKRVIPKGELVVIYGEPGAGKSFFAIDIAAAIGRGVSKWRGNRVTQGKVVVIAAEGAGGMRNRLRAYSLHHSVDLSSLGIGVIADAPNLMQVADTKDLIRAIKAAGETAVVIIDTLAQTTPGANENSGEDMGKALLHCRQIHKHTGATVVLVHHSGKDAAKGARGWSGIKGAADAEIEVSRCDEDRVATVTKLKDGADGAEFGFKLETLVVDIDEDADEVTSCVVVENDAGKARVRAKKGGKSGANERLIMNCLADLSGLSGEPVEYAVLIENVKSQMAPVEEGKRDTRRQVILQAIDSLLAKKVIRNEKGFLSVVQDSAEGGELC